MCIDRKKKMKLAKVLVYLGIVSVPVISAILFLNLRLNLSNKLAAAGWIQALIYWFILIFAGLALYQINLMWRQTKLEEERAEREAYRPLISAEMHSTKRFLHSLAWSWVRNEVEKKLKELEGVVDEDGNSERFQQILDETRKSFDDIAANMNFPLLRQGKVGLDHVEALINEYNYLAKLMVEGKLKPEFATELARENFKRVYELVSPLIKLRQKLSQKYASHFQEYCSEDQKDFE